MLRTNCIGKVNSHRCGKQIRSRVAHKLCRACYYLANREPRPIGRITKERVVKIKPTIEVKTKRKK